jgi:hypothetical protein
MFFVETAKKCAIKFLPMGADCGIILTKTEGKRGGVIL